MSDNNLNRFKPERPEGSPLFWHPSGRWCKKIRGKQHYFGSGQHDDALAEYERQKDALHAGRVPRDESGGMTVYLLCAKFLTAKQAQRENGELTLRSFNEYAAVCKRLLKVFGKGRLVSDLRPDDFAKLRTIMAKTWGPERLKAEIIRSRTPFNWAYKMQLLDRPIVFGEGFKVPSAKTLRTHRAKQGAKMFSADEICRLIGCSPWRPAASVQLRAMILLGINCGYGNNDVATLPLSALDLDAGWVDFARPKTGIGRRSPLWPETVAALRDWLAMRPTPKNPDHSGLVFITYKLGSWADAGNNRALSHEMRKLLDQLGIKGHRSFYSLRHTFQTVGDESGISSRSARLWGTPLAGTSATFTVNVSAKNGY